MRSQATFFPARPLLTFTPPIALKAAAMACNAYLSEQHENKFFNYISKGKRRALAFRRIFIEPQLSNPFKLFALYALLAEKNGEQLKKAVNQSLAITFPAHNYLESILQLSHYASNTHAELLASLIKLIHSIPRNRLGLEIGNENCWLFSKNFLELYTHFILRTQAHLSSNPGAGYSIR